ncbi:MAG: hypothetical protein KGJ89_03340 [Patescibacteria group bacterium]|nr:hypothetical protein [Patescibacteria group bacterium]MDE2015420.1 hypothetical protein [Patescibacteria group bacterium]MDE2226965.1 hypothetical protein [Patescibacteria group bacterium]
MTGAEKVSKILRADKHLVAKLDERLSSVSGKNGVLDKIIEEHSNIIRDKLSTLGIPTAATSKDVYDALISKIESDDHHLFSALNEPDCRRVADCQKVADAALQVAGGPKGLFLKFDKAREFLIKEPPKKIMAFLGYDSAEKMLLNEDLLEVMSALRFIEGSEWLNNVFFKQYGSLTPDDFEERDIRVKALSEKWGAESQKFVIKKRHNISHLKELGVIFVIPVLLGISGEILRMFALILHYLNEIPFYSDIFRDIAKDQKTFTANFTSLLRGDVLENRPAESDKSLWLVVQRYLAKDDENDWRLFVPHINPEALHWLKAEENLASAGATMDHFGEELAFWKDIDWVGDYFKDESGVDVLVSFDLVDTVMSLVKEKEMAKYLYHHQEALWNKVFAEYMGRDKLEDYSKQYLLKGYFEI